MQSLASAEVSKHKRWGTLEAKHNTEDILALHNQWAPTLAMIRANGVCFYKEFNCVGKWVCIYIHKSIPLLIIIKHFMWPFSSILQTQLLTATVHSSIQKLRLRVQNTELFAKELKYHMFQKNVFLLLTLDLFLLHWQDMIVSGNICCYVYTSK